MPRQVSSLLVSTGLLVLTVAFSTRDTHAISAPAFSTAVDLTESVVVEDRVVLERRFDSTRGPCTADLGVPTNRVLPDGTREAFVVPAGKAFVLTDLEGEIAEKLNASWSAGMIGTLTATLTGAVANQYVRARAPLDADAVSAGIVTLKLHLQSGAVADAGATVCLSALVIEKLGFRTATVGTDIRVHGYLVDR
jgi:hypothetical protein